MADRTAEPGLWPGRPPGFSANAPPPSIPLAFFALALAGLVACGIALSLTSSAAVVDPTQDPVVAAAHFGMLATLSMGVMGAIHQFVPVVTQRPLRSIALARLTLASWLLGSWLLPIGFASQIEALVEVGGACAAVAIALLAVDLWTPLGAPGKGAPVTGLRIAIVGLAATGAFGGVYVADRSGAWFDLSGHVLLAHASIGLLAWLGLTYASVGERLLPMFLLAHSPGRQRAGTVAVLAIPAGVLLLSPALLFGIPALGWLGGATVMAGLGAHLVSLAGKIRHRRKAADLYLAFVVTAEASMVWGVVAAIAAALEIGRDHHLGVALAAAAVAAAGGWLLLALLGHLHKVVPFVLWQRFRARGFGKNPQGRQLVFGDLYDHRVARASYLLAAAGVAAVSIGFAVSAPGLLEAGGALLSGTGLVTAGNLSVVPLTLSKRLRGRRG